MTMRQSSLLTGWAGKELQMSIDRINQIAEQLREASAAYYGGGDPIMSDAEFDMLENQLRNLDPSHEVLSQIGSPVGNTGWPKVQHPIVMGSLSKAQDLSGLLAWAATSGPRFSLPLQHPLIVTEKLDGISVLLTYESGKLVRAATRGDGTTGEDITRNVRIMQGVPSEIHDSPHPASLVLGRNYIRGEIVCLKEDFDKFFQGESNPRNTASGTAKRQTGWQKCRHLTVVAYNLTPGWPRPGTPAGAPYESRFDELQTLKSWGFRIPEFQRCKTARQADAVYQAYIESSREEAPYEIDGLVVEIDETKERTALGTTPDGKCPKGAIAYKFPHDMKETTLQHVLWQTGPTGRITPVAVFDAVDLAGANVTRASLHNPDYIEQVSGGRGLAKGARIRVSRRNDVIPAVEELLEQGTGGWFSIPPVCPHCGTSTFSSGAYLICPNEDTCPAQVLGSVKRWLGKTGVLHFGGAMINAVCEAGLVQGLGDLYRLEESEVAALELDGRRIGGAAKRALDSLHSKKEMPLSMFVGSLGINLCGRRMVGMLVDAGYDDLAKLDAATPLELGLVPGFGPKRAVEFKDGFDSRKDTMLDLLAAGVVITKPTAPVVTGSSLAGVAVCFTGVRDKALEADIVAKGGDVKGGVSKNVTVLVCKDPSSTSGKAKKARDLGIELVTLEEMRARVSAA